MRIYTLSHLDLVQRRRTTNRLSDVRFSQGLARNGASVELIVPYAYRADNVRRRGIAGHYGVTEEIRITTLPTPLWDGAPASIRVPVWAGAAALAFAKRTIAGGRPSAWISRDHNAIASLLTTRQLLRTAARSALIVYWAHELRPDDPRMARLYKAVDGVLMTNSAIQEDIESLCSVPRERTAVTVNPVPPEIFDLPPDRARARRRLGIAADARLVVYTGKLGFEFREAEYIAEAASLLPDCDFVLTGGNAEIAEHWTRRCERRGIRNVRFTGFLDDWDDVRAYQMAADVLVSYYTVENKVLDYNYPQKVTEYMASGTPVVAPPARATQDILHPDNTLFVEPHDAAELAAGIRRLLEDPEHGRALAERAYEDARELTFDKWGGRTISFLERLAEESSSDPIR